jgi:hypothetical protein
MMKMGYTIITLVDVKIIVIIIIVVVVIHPSIWYDEAWNTSNEWLWQTKTDSTSEIMYRYAADAAASAAAVACS